MLKEEGRAAIVVPDNVLFEGGAGERIRRMLLARCNVHTLLRLPTGIWYSPGVKANVMFFDKARSTAAPATKELWAYDLRSFQKFSLRQNPIESGDLEDFVKCYRADNLTSRKQSAHFRKFTYAEIIARDKANLDLQWSPPSNGVVVPDTPQSLMKDILADLEEAMREFAAVENGL